MSSCSKVSPQKWACYHVLITVSFVPVADGLFQICH